MEHAGGGSKDQVVLPMRSAGRPASIAAMTPDAQRLTIEIDPGEPINGRLLDAGGAERSFRGWLELSATIEAAREAGADAGRAAAEASTSRDTGAGEGPANHPQEV
ncbi:MAG: hypothetical protein KGJ43_03730 [Acidobacteriota bacterium]|nr:hypothetical protein [Acidobacteriota bacterium]